MIYGSTSIKTIIAKVYRDLQLKHEDIWQNCIEWGAECIEFIGAFDQFIKKEGFGLEVKNFRAPLPCDLYQLIQISKGSIPLIYLTGSFDQAYHDPDDKNLKTPLATNNNTFLNYRNKRIDSRHGYVINGDYIVTNFSTGKIDLSYMAHATDDDGFPLVPDDIYYKDALYKYIVMKLSYPKWIGSQQGMDTTKYKLIEKDANDAIGAAAGEMNYPGIDKLESIKRGWLALVPNINAHSDFFNTLSRQEQLNI